LVGVAFAGQDYVVEDEFAHERVVEVFSAGGVGEHVVFGPHAAEGVARLELERRRRAGCAVVAVGLGDPARQQGGHLCLAGGRSTTACWRRGVRRLTVQFKPGDTAHAVGQLGWMRAQFFGQPLRRPPGGA
jgi:hypothetical protein